MRIVPPSEAETAGAVDLTQLPCTGCRHRHVVTGVPVPLCRRHPPVFIPAQPTVGPNGQVAGLQPGGWMHPPATVKCGEFTAAGCE
jgi:hypothetical protein